MCDPVTATVLAGLAIATSVAGTVVATVGQSQAAAAQNNYQAALANQRNQQIAENNRLAKDAYNRSVSQENLKLIQDHESASRDLQKNQVLALQARARTRVAAGEAGVAGVNVDQLLGDFYRQESLFADATRHNLEYSGIQREMNIEGHAATAQGRMNSMTPHIPRRTEGPSFIGAALKIGTDVFGAASSMGMNYYNSTHRSA